MGLDPIQLREHVIRPTLQRLELWSQAAGELVLGTAIQESNLTYLRQMGNGPALGLWQMEPATHNDIWTNYLHSRSKIGLNILGPYSKPDPGRLVWDLAYACAMCRIHYLRCPQSLPDAGDIKGQAEYWKQFYNTPLGKGTPEKYLSNWHRVMQGG
ncbi:MAG: hypothetical protein HQL84_16125 [Magnetococcales bacterium]|nr:hypothetical protein [Magnetococcales bacterium]MBF0151548.1 hypothetical protein [Magnetococcales bacterium]